ncbi:ROK family protein [Actinomyces sp.]|uniref:ROK family transcriptional regulator n=1 Tax=Actinomyces sp. TaxID=29317 RepID=UPI002899EBEC|nr:ROK family protein [Actinomyces sp.]
MARRRRGPDDEVFELIASGQATTRADISRSTGMAASTVSGVVSRLMREGLVREGAGTEPTGGRPGRNLQVAPNQRRRLVSEFGAHHARVGLADASGNVSDTMSLDIEISQGPRSVLDQLLARGRALADECDVELSGIGIALPGPVDPTSGTVVGPSRMPGWNGCNVPALVAEFSDLPLTVENDARIGARGEHSWRRHNGALSQPPVEDFIYVKAGSAIGGALVLGGAVHRGSHGIAGDITHVPVAAGGNRACQCGNTGCLDTVASAEAIRRDLAGRGLDVPDNRALVAAAKDGEPEVVNALRTTGILLGEALAHNVAFLDPQALIIGGTLSAVEAFTAGVRQALHERCLPSVMEHITVERSRSGMDAALWGLADAMTTGTSPHSTPTPKES